MELFFAHFLRGTVSAIANVVLFISLLQPKYGRKVTNLVMLAILTLNLSTAFTAISPATSPCLQRSMWYCSCCCVLRCGLFFVTASCNGCSLT